MSSAPLPRTVLMTADTIGGVWTYALEAARALASHGVKIALATMGRPISDAQRSELVAIENLHVFESDFQLEWMPEPWSDVDRAGAWLLDLEREILPDVVHLNGYAHGALAWRAPTLIVGHSCVLSWWQAVKCEAAPMDWDEYARRVRAGLQAADLVVAPTRAMLAALQEYYGPLPRTRVIHNARAAASFAPGEKEPFILAAGRLGDEAKNIRTLGASAAGLPWPVEVAGHVEDASGCAPLPENVRPCGFLPPAALAARMAHAAIYCLPARYEPFGLSVLEAALSGCTLVLGDIASLRELWADAALFVPPNDAAALHTALARLIADAEMRRSLGEAARERALQFGPERFGAAYLSAYRDLLAPAAASFVS